MLRFTKLVN